MMKDTFFDEGHPVSGVFFPYTHTLHATDCGRCDAHGAVRHSTRGCLFQRLPAVCVCVYLSVCVRVRVYTYTCVHNMAETTCVCASVSVCLCMCVRVGGSVLRMFAVLSLF